MLILYVTPYLNNIPLKSEMDITEFILQLSQVANVAVLTAQLVIGGAGTRPASGSYQLFSEAFIWLPLHPGLIISHTPATRNSCVNI